MILIEKLTDFKADGIDIALIKLAVFFATLFIAKLWQPLLSLEWYWYLILWLAAATRPMITFYKWLNPAKSK